MSALRAAWAEDRPFLVAWAASVVVGVAIRIALAFAADGKSWSDSAIIALMAMHALKGHFYTFYWGQDYMGSIESLAVAPFFALFGVSDPALSMGLLPWYVLFAAALYPLVRRCGGPLAAALSGWVLAFAPPYVQYQQIMPRGDYPETLAFGTLLLWLTLRVTHDGQGPRAERDDLVWIGFVAGLAFWTNWLVFPYFAVAALYLFLNDWRLPFRPRAWLALAAFFLGSLPFWVTNVRKGFPTFSFVEGGQGTESSHIAFGYAITKAIPVLFGFRDLNEQPTFGWPGRTLTFALALALLALVAGLWRSWLALLRGRIRDTQPVVALLLLMVAMVGVYTVSLPGRFHVPRYLLPITSSAVALTALALGWLAARSRALAAVAGGVLLVFQGAQIVEFGRGMAADPTRPGTEGPVDKLADHLLARGIRFGYADYGDATIATYLARDRVVLTDYTGARYPLDEVPFHDPAIILREGQGTAEGSLAALNATYESSRLRGYRVYSKIRYDGIARAPLPRSGFHVQVSHDQGGAASLFDGDRWTYWEVPAATEAPSITLDLGGSTAVNGVYFDLGERIHDSASRLRIERSSDGTSWTPVKDAEWGFPVQFDPHGEATTVQSGGWYVLFPTIESRFLRMTRLESNGVYNWSVGELEVLGPGTADAALRLPAYEDPRHPALAERRLRLQSTREPGNDAPLVELRRLYRSLGDSAKLAEIARLEAERFNPQVPLGWRFGRDLTLVGYDGRASGPRELTLTYYWQAMRRMDSEYAVSLRIHGAGGEAQDDLVPDTLRATYTWKPEEIVKLEKRIAIPATLKDGTYQATVGVWVPQTRRRVRTGPFGLWGKTTRKLFRIDVRGDHVEIQPGHS